MAFNKFYHLLLIVTITIALARAEEDGSEEKHDVNFSPEQAYDFKYTSDGRTYNAVIMDAIRMCWGYYFALCFGLFGAQLERFGTFYYSLELFGISQVWNQMRDNPAVMDPVIFQSLMRALFGAAMCQVTTKMFQTENVLQAWTIVVSCTGFLINIFDYYLRDQAGCEIGEASDFFPFVGWKNCDDWQMAYNASWIYSGFSYVVLLVFICCGSCISKYAWVTRVLSEGAVASVAAASLVSSANITLASYPELNSDRIAFLMSFVYYIGFAAIFCFEEVVNKFTTSLFDPKQITGKKCRILILKPLLFLTLPLVLLEKMFTFLERICVSMLVKQQEEEDDEFSNSVLRSVCCCGNFSIDKSSKGDTVIDVVMNRPSSPV